MLLLQRGFSLLQLLLIVLATPPHTQVEPEREADRPRNDLPQRAGEPGSPSTGGPPVPAPGAPVVETISGQFQGALKLGVATTAGDRILQVGGVTVPMEDVLFIHFAEKARLTGEVLVFLRDGSELFSTILAGDEDDLHLRAQGVRDGQTGNELLRVSLEEIRGIAFPGNMTGEPTAAITRIRRWLFGTKAGDPGHGAEDSKPAQDEDRVRLVEGAELAGILVMLDAQSVRFQSTTTGNVKIPLEKVQGISVAEIGPSLPAATEAPGIEVAVELDGGSALSGRLLNLDPTEIRLFTRTLGEVIASSDHVKELRVLGGRCQYLSDLEPLRIAYGDDLFRPWPLQRDLSAGGGPLRIRGRFFKKGLGMHSYCRADYALDGKYLKFQTVIGMDDLARPPGSQAENVGGGIAIFRVYVDDRKVLDRELSWSDSALPIDIPIEGAHVLSLELDYGKGFLVLDRGNWGDARIIQEKNQG